jgi:hypothetical protein
MKTNTAITISRKQLQAYGLTSYYAIKITKNLTPVLKKNCAYFYNISDLITTIKYFLQQSNSRPKTSHSLRTALDFLLQLLDNKIEVIFQQDTDSEISCLARKVLRKMQKTDRNLAEITATAMTIKNKYNNKK